MPHVTHDTTSSQVLQARPPCDDWQQEVLPRLPERLVQQAKALKAFERSSKIGSASDLLRGLLAYVYTVHSFGHLAMWSVLIGLGDVSANDWRKRLRKAYAWLTWLLGELLAASGAISPWLVQTGLRRVLLIDGTHWSCPGPKGVIWRVHTAFDLLSGRLSQLKVTDTHEAEHLEVFELQEGDLVITDNANGYRERIAYACKCLAFLLVRFNPSTLPLEDAAGKALDLFQWLKARHAPPGRICGLCAWITSQDGQRIPLRVVALRLSAEQREKAQRRKKQRAIRQQRKMRPETLYLSGWLLVVSTLPQEQWSDAAVLQLYRARWHIELVFKRIKQLLKQQRLHCTTKETAQATLTALLVGWALLEEERSAVRIAMADAMQAVSQEPTSAPRQESSLSGSWWQVEGFGPLSEWMLAEVCFDLLCQQIRGSYTAARFRACLPQLQRFLCSGHRSRPHLYSQVCRWLGMPAGGGDLLAQAS